MNQTNHLSTTVLILFLIISGHLAYSHNGKIAYAKPITGITIDGNLSDWPADVTRYAIGQHLYGFIPESDKDILATLMIGYNLTEQSLYVGVEVIDEDYVKNENDPAFYNHDQHVLYLDKTHARGGAGVIALEVNEYINIVVHQQDNPDPLVKGFKWKDVQYDISRIDNKTIYEWKIYVGDYLVPGQFIGFDYAIFDCDESDGSSQTTWGYGEGIRHECSSCLGDVYLTKPGDQVGAINGKVTSGTMDLPHTIFAEHEDSRLYTHLRIDTTGYYESTLPTGVYHLSIEEQLIETEDNAFRLKGRSEETVIVKKDQKTQVPDLLVDSAPKPQFPPGEGIVRQFGPEHAKIIDETIEAYQTYYRIPGVSFALIRNGELAYHQTYGVTNSIKNTPVNEHHLFEAASISKTVFAFLVNKLAEQGTLDLDKPLHEYLPFEDLEQYPDYRLMTARHVVTHRTGLPNWGQEIKFKPGTDFGYSGEGFEYLKRVVVKITGKPIEKLINEEVKKPLGLYNIEFSDNSFLRKNVVTGHRNGVPTVQPLPYEAGMAWSMHTEAKAFSRFALALYERKGLKSETYEEFFTIQSEVPEDWITLKGYQEGVGMGIFVRDTPIGKAFNHGGNNGDFKCEFEMYDETGDGYILLTNSDTGDYIYQDLGNYLFGNVYPSKDER